MVHAKFAVVANCQARPLSQLVKLMMPDWEHVGDVIVHLSNAAREDQDVALLANADIIFAQLVADEYPTGHLATSRLKSELDGRIVVWPNLFFHGQTPDTFYLTGARRISGPLDHYHSLTIFEHWREGRSVESCLAHMLSEEADDASALIERVARSLSSLRQRETLCHVAISDFIEDRWREEPLFHVFNHPCGNTLIELARRVVKAAECVPAVVPVPSILGEPLGRLVPPVPRGHARALDLAYPTAELAKGLEVNFEEEWPQATTVSKIWLLPDLIEAFYRCYGLCGEQMTSVRLTPAP